MNKYIGENRLTYLWGKIKAFVSNAISGKVDKVSSSTDNAIVRFDGTSGNIQNSGVTINDSNHLTAAKLITSGGTSSQFVKGDGSLDSNTYATESYVQDEIETLTDGTVASESGTTIDIGEYDLMKIREIKGNSQVYENTVVGNSVEKLDVTGFNMLGLTGRTEYATNTNPTNKWDFLSEHIVIKGMSVNGYCRPANIINYSISTNSVTVETSTSSSSNAYGIGLPVRVNPDTSYYFVATKSSSSAIWGIVWYDRSGYLISYADNVNIVTSPINAYWAVIVFKPNAVDTEATFTNPVFNISNTSKNGTYEEYKHSEFPLNLTELTGKVNGEGTSVTIFPDGLHGVGTAYDSLIVDEDGYARRAVKRMGSVDLGTLDWYYHNNGYFYGVITTGLARYDNMFVTSKYVYGTWSQVSSSTSTSDKVGTISVNNNRFNVRDSSYSTTAAFKAAMDGVMLHYELATPIEYVLDTPVQCVTKVYPNGTVKQVPVMPDSTPMIMDVTYLHDTGGVIGGMIGNYATKKYVDDIVGDIETLLASI